MRARRGIVAAAIGLVLGFLGALGLVERQTTTTFVSAPVTEPIRAAFYYPWFPETWGSGTDYTPKLGFYSTNYSSTRTHIRQMQYAKISSGIASWWGRGSITDSHIPMLLRAATDSGTGFTWTLYDEAEGATNPTVSEIAADLTYIGNRYGASPSFMHIDGKPVIFVYAEPADACGMVDRWTQANAGRFYLVLKVFPGYATCPAQPDSWHQYGPASATVTAGQYSFSVSPGFNKAGEPERLARDPARFRRNVREMVASGAQWQLVTTFNEWGEGTAIEPALEWGRTYLRILANNAVTPSSTPPPSTTPPPIAGLLVAVAGDLCGDCRGTSDLVVANDPDLVLTTGDNAYPDGTAADFRDRYNPNWGRFKAITQPSPGNHEYHTSNAQAYRDYFGLGSGVLYHSFNQGGWHFVQLNTERMDSVQVQWAAADLASNDATCEVAYGHTPRWSSGDVHGSDSGQDAIWRTLVGAGVDVVAMGHDHTYERIYLDGTREFVVGTGGGQLYHFGSFVTGSEQHVEGKFGVLFLTLGQNHYSWQFKDVTGAVLDSGSASCR